MQKKMSIQQVKQIIQKHFQNYKPDKIIIKHLSGLTNQTFKVQYQNLESLVFRKFSPISDTKLDNQVYKCLQQANIAPKCIYACSQYRIEKFIEDAKHPNIQKLRQKELKKRIIEHMGKFHSTQIQVLRKKPIFMEYILSQELFLKIKKKNDFQKNENFQHLYKLVTQQYEKLEQIRLKYLQKKTEKNNFKIKVCHNDLNNLNIFFEPQIIFIDYDYCSYNYLAYDIANFLNETTINYSINQFPYFKNQRLITPQQIKQSVLFYPQKYQSIQQDIAKSLALCNLYWAVWSILMTGDPSQNNFGTVQHGLMRFNLYKGYELLLKDAKF